MRRRENFKVRYSARSLSNCPVSATAHLRQHALPFLSTVQICKLFTATYTAPVEGQPTSDPVSHQPAPWRGRRGSWERALVPAAPRIDSRPQWLPPLPRMTPVAWHRARHPGKEHMFNRTVHIKYEVMNASENGKHRAASFGRRPD